MYAESGNEDKEIPSEKPTVCFRTRGMDFKAPWKQVVKIKMKNSISIEQVGYFWLCPK